MTQEFALGERVPVMAFGGATVVEKATSLPYPTPALFTA